MSAIVLGKRSSSCFFEDHHLLHQHHAGAGAATATKRIRFSTAGASSSSPIRFSPPQPSPTAASSSSPTNSPSKNHNTTSNNNNSSPAPLAHLRSLFLNMDERLLERAFEASGNDLDSAVRCLNELCLGSSEPNLGSSVSSSSEGIGTTAQPSPEATMNNLPANGSEWAGLFVREMMNASNEYDASARISRVLEVLEKSITERASADAAASFRKENVMLKEQVEGLLRDNDILKRAVAIQHEYQKEHDDRNPELNHLKQLVSHYQEQLRKLEVNNYALTMHLRQAQQSSSILGRFHPDVF